MRESIAAVALICREDSSQMRWLAQWNPKWRSFNFISGHKRPDESFQECLLREVEEELGLQRDIDFNADAHPVAQLDFVAWSESARAETRYRMELFDVHLTSEAVWSRVLVGPETRLVTEAEIASRRTADGRRVSETMQRLLDALSAQKP
jgi:8-oxo-dGTP pyrophosphatase MutT (NUDIX family)